jgi:2-polyprenyl-3-methyl-5-hydroxy-6-metoxy-1,4-benzoquinol methylase
MSGPSLPASYFDALYAADPDPWGFAASDYESDKYAKTLAALPRQRYAWALEVGCSIGVLTRQLAGRCEGLVSIDASGIPLRMARERCRDCSSVRFSQMIVPQDWPDGEFDLILLSEIVYYLCAADVAHLARRVETSLAVGGDVVLVHWTGATNYPLSGDEAAEIFLREVGGFTQVARRERASAFRLDVVTRRQCVPQPSQD